MYYTVHNVTSLIGQVRQLRIREFVRQKFKMHRNNESQKQCQ